MCGMVALDSASLLAIVRRMFVLGTSVYTDPFATSEAGFDVTGMAPEKTRYYMSMVWKGLTTSVSINTPLTVITLVSTCLSLK